MNVTAASEVWRRCGKCPRCKAEPGDPCRTPSDRLAGMVHAGRPQWQETGSTEQPWEVEAEVADDELAESKPVDLVHHARERRQKEERRQKRRENRKGKKYHSLGTVIPIQRGQQLRNPAKANEIARRAERAAKHKRAGKKNKRRRTDADA